jgi:hypothetical protein
LASVRQRCSMLQKGSLPPTQKRRKRKRSK